MPAVSLRARFCLKAVAAVGVVVAEVIQLDKERDSSCAFSDYRNQIESQPAGKKFAARAA
jgi:hypothetical protein